MTTKEILTEIQKKMNAHPAKLVGIRAVLRFDISGADPGIYSVSIADGKVAVSEGPSASPNITIIIDSTDFADLVEGRLGRTAALLSGKLRVQGDMIMAMQLQSLLK